MIGALAAGVESVLRGRRYPVRIEVGPRLSIETAPFAITLDLDRGTPDEVGAPVVARGNPVTPWSRSIGCVARVFAGSTKGGARLADHEVACNALVDALLVALREWAVGSGFGLDLREVRAMPLEDRGGGEVARGGEAYVVRFAVRRALVAVDYTGIGELTGTAAGVATASRISLDGANYEELD